MKLGIFGGSFNPIHVGHLVAARDALERVGLDRIAFLPCGRPPHKIGRRLAPAPHRAAMIEAAIAVEDRMELDRRELERTGRSYTIDTVLELRAERPAAEIFLLIGADVLFELPTWKDVRRLLELCTVVPLARPGFARPADPAAQIRLPRPWPDRLVARWTDIHGMDISSTEIRRRLARGLPVRYFLPESVETYIRKHHLYGA